MCFSRNFKVEEDIFMVLVCFEMRSNCDKVQEDFLKSISLALNNLVESLQDESLKKNLYKTDH